MFNHHRLIDFIILILLLTPWDAESQVRHEILIGRTTGILELDEGQTIRVSGFTNTLSGQVSLPGITLDAVLGDSIVIDFWNISQGDPHDFTLKGIPTRKSSKWRHNSNDLSIYHMDHGYYHFTAEQTGTYLYYCPIKYPFNVQAGMFGLLIIRSEKPTADSVEADETLWCGFEIDTNWHTDSILDEEVYEFEKAFSVDNCPAYDPQHFLINGLSGQEAADSLALKGTTSSAQVIRIANAGLFMQKITFPEGVVLAELNPKETDSKHDLDSSVIHLAPLETIELIVLSSTPIDSYIEYAFLNESSVDVLKIPISIQTSK